MKNKFNLAILAIVAAGIIRLLPHPYNLTPIGGMALAGGAYLGRQYLAFVIPFVTLFVTDIILNNTVNRVFFTEAEGLVIFSDYMLFSYLAFGLTVMLGLIIGTKNKSKLVIGGALVSSIIFFLITNFGTFLTEAIYPKTGSGLLTCYAAAIPFFWNTLVSHLVYTLLIVLGVESASKFSLAPATKRI